MEILWKKWKISRKPRQPLTTIVLERPVERTLHSVYVSLPSKMGVYTVVKPYFLSRYERLHPKTTRNTN
jgi:hypothetical protein